MGTVAYRHDAGTQRVAVTAQNSWWSDIVEGCLANATVVQALLFGTVMVGCWSVERAWLGRGDLRKSGRARINAMFVLCALPIQVGMTTVCVALAAWVTEHHWGVMYLVPIHDNAWIKYGLMFVVLDLLDYVYHYAMHHIPVLWRFHLVHHTDQAIDASTTVREHPGETAVRNGFLILWVLICGASLEVLVLRQSVETVANILSHTTFRLRNRPARVLGWLLITPNLHHVHHHRCRPYTDRNYGDVFSVWDRVFGTFANLALEDTQFGLDTHPAKGRDHRFGGALAMPFAARPTV